MWKVTFNDCGGYDCMTPAYTVKRSDSDEQIVVDAKDFSWHGQLDDYVNDPRGVAALQRCEVIALAIAAALNILE